MNWGKIMNFFGLAMLVLIFLWSAVVVLSPDLSTSAQGKKEIRFAHWQLESGLREAFDRVAEDYMALHPDVVVKQIAVPGKAYPTWLTAGMTSRLLPDLVILGAGSDETLANHFLPMTEYVLRPNHYNEGTSLEGVPWKDTFLGGLSSSHGVNTLQEYYSIPSAIMTIRMYYNKTLWREIFGSAPPPATYGEFLAACEKIQSFAEQTSRPLVPVAGSNLNADILLGALFQSQTQKRAIEIDRLNSLTTFSGVQPRAIWPGFASLDDPAVRDGFEIMREAGNLMQSGFMQVGRDEAILHFAQGRAVMLPSGVWDYGSIVEQSDFEIGVFPIPVPEPSESGFGANVMGRPAESGAGNALGFLLFAGSKHPEIAVDFLKFLTSQKQNQIFANISKWPPSVLGVKTAPETEIFAPIQEGFPAGFSLAKLAFSSGDVYLLLNQNLHKLFGKSGSVSEFVEAIRPHYNKALRSDLARGASINASSAQRMDSIIASLAVLAENGDAEEAQKLSAILQSQNSQESNWGLIQNRMQQTEQ